MNLLLLVSFFGWNELMSRKLHFPKELPDKTEQFLDVF